MRIIHVEDYFDPDAGYQINELLRAGNVEDEVILVTSTCMKPFHKELNFDNDRKFEKETGVKIIRLKPILIISSRILYNNLFSTLNSLKPDVVFFHGIGDFKDFMLFRKKKKYVVIRDCHMSWIASQNRFRFAYYKIYRLMFSSIINRTNKYYKIYALGEEERQYLLNLGIDSDKIDYLYHGYNDEIMFYSEQERKEIRNNYNVNDDGIIISYIGKFDDAKRPDLIFDIIGQINMEIFNHTKVTLLFIGPKNEKYMSIFLSKLNNLDKKINVIIEESKLFVELRKYYSASDICIFPKECTLSSIHAQVCKSIVIMENHISNKERVVKKEDLYKINDIKDAARILEKIICSQSYIIRKKQDLPREIFLREYKTQVQKLSNDIMTYYANINGDKYV